MCSPRVILVANEGHLVGLVTVKDVLRYEAQVEHQHAMDAIPPTTSLPPREAGHTRADSASSWVTAGAGGDWEPMADPRAGDGLEATLEEGLRWVTQRAGGLGRAVDRFRTGPRNGRSGVEEAMEYELDEERGGHPVQPPV